MSTTTPHNFRRIVLIGLCVLMLMTSYTLILAPCVGAASDANKTETETKNTEDITSAESELLAQRASIMDEAKKEAQETVSEKLAEQEAAKKKAEAATEAPTSKPQTGETSAPSTTVASENTGDDGEAESGSDYDYETEYTYDTGSASSSDEYLLDIDNPDYSYVGYSISLSDEDRDMTERIIMGESGGEGFTGMALVAQCIRDTYISGNYSSIAQLLKQNGYYGSTSIAPSQTAKEVVNYIFDQGGSAVQHRISIFYASNLCSSAWHESQEFVCQYGYVRFFNY